MGVCGSKTCKSSCLSLTKCSSQSSQRWYFAQNEDEDPDISQTAYKNPIQNNHYRLYSIQEKHFEDEINCFHVLDRNDLISCHDLYNILNDGAIKPVIHDPDHTLLIDTRDEQDYDYKHIITSVHCNDLSSSTNFDITLANYSLIVIYGGKLIGAGLDKVVALRDHLQPCVACELLILSHGFKCFHQLYPFLCTDKEINSVFDRQLLLVYPSVVFEDELFQGRGEQAINQVIVENLCITHILNVTVEYKNAFPGRIKYLKLSIEDESQCNLCDHFHTASRFIHEAITNGGRVLVHCNQGVSRSSTFTLAYLIKYRKWRLEVSLATLKARRPCVCPNPGFLNQLSQWEAAVLPK